MAYRAYVGNLPFSFTQADLQGLFAEFGSVRSAELILDRETGRPRGFGFVELETAEQLQAAIAGLSGRPIAGRPLTVTEARERESRGPGGFRSGPPRSAPQPPSRGPAPASGPAPGPASGPGGRGRSEPERERAPRRARGMDDYDRHDKRWKRGGDDWE